ncbi:MAG: gamma-glutamyl-gamma-aminobutyrate hydrolase family protein [Arenimonas sp.]|jgi:putative glutamine amidotransferase
MPRAPLVGLPSDNKVIGLHRYQAVGEKYVRGVIDGAGAIPLLIPSMSPPLPLRELLGQLDGLFLTGSYSNIEPHHYSDEPSYEGNLHDPARDATSLSLVPLAIELRLPVLAVCRGLQEVNVALGGSLHQKVQEVPGRDDHREDDTAPLDEQYGPSHSVSLRGSLARIAGADRAMVNSLHGQGIDRLGRGLLVEAIAPDGLVEGVRLDSAQTFLLAVQWHPEWKVTENPFYLGIFQEFAAACRARAAQRA